MSIKAIVFPVNYERKSEDKETVSFSLSTYSLEAFDCRIYEVCELEFVRICESSYRHKIRARMTRKDLLGVLSKCQSIKDSEFRPHCIHILNEQIYITKESGRPAEYRLSKFHKTYRNNTSKKLVGSVM